MLNPQITGGKSTDFHQKKKAGIPISRSTTSEIREYFFVPPNLPVISLRQEPIFAWRCGISNQSRLEPRALHGNGVPSLLKVGGSLLFFSAFWSQKISEAWVQSVVSMGYKFHTLPPVCFKLSNRSPSPSQHADLLSVVQLLSSQEAINPIPPWECFQAFFWNLFKVPKPNGEICPIIKGQSLPPSFQGTFWPQ